MYDALRCSKHHAQMGHVAQVSTSGIARLVGVQRAVQNMKGEPKYLACEESLVRAFYC